MRKTDRDKTSVELQPADTKVKRDESAPFFPLSQLAPGTCAFPPTCSQRCVWCVCTRACTRRRPTARWPAHPPAIKIGCRRRANCDASRPPRPAPTHRTHTPVCQSPGVRTRADHHPFLFSTAFFFLRRPPTAAPLPPPHPRAPRRPRAPRPRVPPWGTRAPKTRRSRSRFGRSSG